MKKIISCTKIFAFFLAIIMLLETMPLTILAGELAPSVKITFNGEEVSEVTLIEDDRITLSAETDFTGDTISYQWEIYANKDEGMWVKIGDKKSKDCVVTYALVSSLLDDNGCAKLRVSATSGSDTAVSDPVTVKVSYLVNNLIKNNSAAATSEPVVMKSAHHASLAALNSESVLIGDNVKAEADGTATTYLITLKYHFVDVNGNFVANVLSDDRTLSVTKDSPQYDAVLPVQIGYTPVLVPTDFDCEINQIDGEYILHLNFSNISSNIEITINYTPNHNITYTVYHHVQNPGDDRYTIHSTEVFPDGIVGEPVPEGLQYSKDELDGYDYLYYIREMVTPDGQTSIHIYYDCKYYLVSFDLDVNGQGQDPIYVRYGSEIYLNTPERIGFGFKGYELRRYGNTEYDWTYSISSNDEVEINYANSDTSNMAKYSIDQRQVASGTERKPIIVTTDLHYEVIWSSTETEFTVLYWKENANDGNYSLWGKQTVKTYKDGTHVYSGDVVNALTYSALPDDLNTDEAKEFFVYNEAKTASGGDVVVQGNGTTTVSVYYLRRRYTLEFTIDTTIPSGTTEANCPYQHTHGKDCIMGTSDCTHVHTDECVTNGTCSKAHVHDNSCTLQCSDPVHIHSSDCCVVHVHEPMCYGAESNTPVTNFNGINIPTRAKQGEIYANVINDSWWRFEADYYVFIGNNWYKLSSKSASILESFLKGEGCDDVRKGTMSTGQIASSESCKINKHSAHDHTFGCCYSSCDKEHTHTEAACGLNCVDTKNHNNFNKHTDACFTCGKLAHSHESTAKCNTTEHVHTSECYSCKTEEHVCDAYCNCTHVHNEDCYTPCILTHDCKDHATSAQTNPVVFKITAKYEQDISELWPDFEYMQKLGWATKDDQNFYAWNFQIGEGEGAQSVTQYYKYPNMIADICFTYNMNIKALYSASTKPYVVYFMFEDLDQKSTSVKPFSSNGTARQQHNGKWYTSSLEHFQGFFMPSTTAPEPKSILGMYYLYTDTNQPDMNLNGLDCDVYVFYYDRNTAGINIQLYNSDTTTPIVVYAPTATTVSGVSATIDTDVKFGMPVSEIISEDLFTGKALTVPEQYRYGYEFGGWYASEYPADSTKVYSYTTVPNQVLMLFAYWKPIEYTVRIWNSDPSADETATLNTSITVPYGHTVNFDIKNFTYNPYSEVIGCFYHDDTDGDGIADTEKRFLFNNIPVKGDMDLYAKWSSRDTIKYVLKYVYVDPDTGNEIQIARDEEGYTLSGQSKTFTAKTSDQLFGPYQKNYYPTIRTATVNLMSDNDPETEDVVSHTFYYEFDDTMEYYVHYLPAAGSTEEEITKFNAALAEAAKANPDLADGVIVCKDEDTHFAIVTEDFISLPKFLPDAYSKSLVLTATKNEEEAYPYVNNHIYFYYTYNETEAYYKIVHQTQNLENMSSYTEFSSSQIVGLIGADTAPEKAKDNIVGFHFAKAEAWTVDKDGNTVVTTLSPDGGNYKSTISANGTTIYFFYDRNSYDYSVKYTDKATEELELSPTVNGSALYQSTVIAPYVDLEAKAWQIVGEAADRKIVIEAESQGDLRNNTTVFMYTELTAVINYVLVGSEGGKLNITNQDVVGAATGRGVLGSEAVLLDSENYRFVGWFEDEACTVPVTDNNPAYTLESTNGLNFNKITPKKYDTGHTDSNGQSILLYQNATYYAKFEPNNATLTITVNADKGDVNQRVLLHIVGKADTNAEKVDLIVSVALGNAITINDIPVGEYTISEVSGDWTWRYGESGVQNVTVPVGGGSTEFILTLSIDQWFDSDSYGTYNNVTSYSGQ